MREYKIVVDFNEKESFRCYERTYFGFFNSIWELIESTATHDEALTFLQGKDGRFLGTYRKDGTMFAVNEVVKMPKGTTYTSDGLLVNKAEKPHFIPNLLDDDSSVLHSRKVLNKK